MPKASKPAAPSVRTPSLAEAGAAQAQWRVEQRSAPCPGGPSTLRVYRPLTGEQPRAGLVFFHAGGFVVGDPASHDALCGAVCRDADCVVVSCGYRLAPEHRFPCAVDDAYFASCFVHEHADELGIDHRRLGIAGVEVGANLAITVARLAKERRNPALQLQWLISPALDLRVAAPRAPEPSPAACQLASRVEQYVRSPADRLDPRCTPLLAKNLIGLPPVFITSSGYDDGRAFAQLLEAVQVPVQRYELGEAAASFIDVPDGSEQNRAALREHVQALTAALRCP
jgi:acetyl esterase